MGNDRKLVSPAPKYTDPLFAAVAYSDSCPNGLSATTAGVPVNVIAVVFPLVSTIRFELAVSNPVPVIAVSGAVGGVKFAV